MPPEGLESVRSFPDEPGPPMLGFSPEAARSAIRERILEREIAFLKDEQCRLRAQLAGAAEVDGQHSAQDIARLLAKDALIRDLYHSTSWRVTAPLRWVKNVLSGRQPTECEAAIRATDRLITETPVEPEPSPRFALPTGAHPEQSTQGEVLIIADHLPLFDRQSGGLRLKTLIGMMGRLGLVVTFCSYLPRGCPDLLQPETVSRRYENALREAGVSQIVYGLDEMRLRLRDIGGSIRFAFVSFPVVAREVIPILRIYCPWARVIFDTVDLHFLRIGREAALRGSAELQREAETMREVEFACMRMADVTITVSEEERAMLLDLLPEVVVETLPNIFTLPHPPPPGLSGRRGVLFLGGFLHGPNIDAVRWFVSEIWPRLRAEAPDLVFTIAGANPPAEVLALSVVPGVEVLGYIPDLAPVFAEARVFVAPLRYGAGMKGKVGQSMAFGLPVVATSIGAEGMGAVDGVHLLRADAAEEFAESVLLLLRDDVLWRNLAAAGRRLVSATLSEQALSRRVAELFHV